MPFTPFHFGPAMLVKAVAPRRFSWSAFVLTQVIIDCETLYNIVLRRYPLHRELHTFVGATAAGIGSALLMLGALRALPKFKKPSPALISESSTQAIWAGAILGGLSHPLLDGVMHDDVLPFSPWSTSNPFLGAIELGALHLSCFVAGVAGLVLVVRWINHTNRLANNG